jgi:hypothetical protein
LVALTSARNRQSPGKVILAGSGLRVADHREIPHFPILP